jgi:hypothetical protein
MSLLVNRARMTTATTGTGALTLGLALAGYLSLNEAGVPNAATVTYCIEDGSNFEIGRGVYSSSGQTLTRAAIIVSKIHGEAPDTAPISLSGSATVFITGAAEDLLSRNAAIADNAILRGDGGAGGVQASAVTISDTGIVNGAIAVGVNAVADAVNRLSVASAAILFNHEGAGTQLKVNKAAAGNTASHLFQTSFSGRAEIGLLGNDDFSFKVSPDGTNFFTGLLIDKDDGFVSLPIGVLDFPERAAPANPISNIARLYAFDESGATKLGIKDSAGATISIGGGAINTASGALSINGTPFSASVQSTGLNGIDGDQLFIFKTYTDAPGVGGHPSSELSVLRVQRHADYTGGTFGNVENAIWARHTVEAGVANFEWSILAQLENHATAGENVAIYARADKMSGAGPTWAATYAAQDYNTNPASQLVGQEIGMFANGGDSNLARVGIDIVAGKRDTGGATATIGIGLRLGPQNSDAANGVFTHGIYFDETFGIGINLANANCSTADIVTKGSVGFGTSAPDRRLHSEVADAVTNTTTQALRLTHTTSGTAAAGFAVGMEAELENASGTNVLGGSLEWVFTDPTNASEDTDLFIKLIQAGAPSVNVARFTSTGRLGLGPAAPAPAVSLDVRDPGDTQLRAFSNGTVDARLNASSSSGCGFVGTYTNHPLLTVINGIEAMRFTTNRLPIWAPASTTPETLGTNGTLTMTPTSNTNLRFSYRGSDGTTRVANLTLA